MIFGSGQTGGNAIGTGIIFSLYDNFSSTADRISSKWKSLDALTEESGKRMGETMNKMKLGFAGMVVGAAIVAPILLAVGAAQQFEKGMAKINTTAQLSQPELAALRDELLDLGKGAVGDLNKIPAAYEKIISQTNDVVLSTDILKSALKGAKAGFADVDIVSAALAQTLSIVGKENTTASEVIDTLFAAKRVGAGEFSDFAQYLPTLIAAGKNLGLTYQETSGIFAFFTGKGQDAANSAVLMQNAFSALQKVDIQDGFKKAGVAIFDAQGKMRSMVDIFTDLNKITGKMSQEQKTNLFASVGLKDVQARNAFSVLSSDVNKLRESMSATMNPAGELNKALAYGENNSQRWEIALNKLKYVVIKLGTVFLPIATTAAEFFGAAFGVLADIFSLVASNPVGQFILKLAGAFGVLTFGVGAFVVVTNLARFAAAKAAVSFATMGMTEVAAAFATGGLTAGMSALAVAVWAVLAPLLPFIAAGALVVGLFYGMYEGVKSFNAMVDGTGEKLTGIAGFFQKVGGVIQGVMDIWKSATSEGFSLSTKTYDALQKLGIAEFVLNLGTWVVRIKEIFRGIYETIVPPLKEVWNVFSNIFSKLYDVGAEALNGLGFNIGKLGGSMETFRMIGHALGTVLKFTVVPIFYLLGAAIGIAGGILVGIIAIVRDVVDIFKWLGSTIYDLSSAFVSFGANIVSSIWSGITSGWSWLVDQFTKLISDLPGGGYILQALGIDVEGSGGGQVAAAPVTAVAPTDVSPLGAMSAETKNPFTGASNTYSETKSSKEVMKNITVHLDGNEIKSWVDSKDRETDSRQ